MHCDTLKQDNDSTVRGDGGSRVGEVRTVTVRDPPNHTSSLRVNTMLSESEYHYTTQHQIFGLYIAMRCFLHHLTGTTDPFTNVNVM